MHFEDPISKVQSHYQTNGAVKLIPDDTLEGHKLPEDIKKQLSKSKQTIDYKFQYLSELKDGINELENKNLSESKNGIDKLEIYKSKNKNNKKNRKITLKVKFLYWSKLCFVKSVFKCSLKKN
jgi:hypothetical protein